METELFKRYINWEYWSENYEKIIKTGFDFPRIFIRCIEYDYSVSRNEIKQLLDTYYPNPHKENAYYPLLTLIEFTEKYPKFKELIKPCTLNYKNSVALIFSKPSSSWGLRGDPYFWMYLEEKFAKYSIPFVDIDSLEIIIKKEYSKLCSKIIGEVAYIEQFAHGGMSSGSVSGIWVDLIPLLKYRLIKLNNDYYLNRGEYSKIIENPEKIIKTTNMSFDEILERYDKPLGFWSYELK